MLDSLRTFSKTWIAKILLAFLVISFGAFGINNVITGFGSSTVARVGDQDVTVRDFQRAYSQQLNTAAQQLGKVPTTEEAQALGIPGQVLQGLAQRAVIDQLTSQLGLGVSENKLGELVRNDPNFSGTLGGFSAENFRSVLAQSGLTEAEYIESQSDAARRDQLVQSLFISAPVPETAQGIVNRYSADTRSIEYILLNDRSVPEVPAPSEEELTAYLAAHQTDFRTPETRTADVMTLSPEALAAGISVPDDQVVAEYERTKASLTTPERRTVRQVGLPVEGLVVAFQNGKTEGRSFDELAQQAGEQITEFGSLARSEITDDGLAEAAFSLVPGDFAIIEGIGGKRAVSVSAIQPGHEPTLDEARPEIVQRLAVAQARTQFGDIQDQVEELRAAFQPLQTIADRYKLPMQTLPITASGAELAPLTDIAEADRARVGTAIFAAQQGQLSSAVALSANRYVFFDLKSVEPARDQTLDEVHDQVVAAVTAERTEAAVEAQVQDAVNQLRSGTPFADLASKFGQFPQLSIPITRNGDGSNLLDATVGAEVFSGGADHVGAARNGDGDQVVFHVVGSTPAAGPVAQEGRDYIVNSARNSLYSQFVQGLLRNTEVRSNPQAIEQALALGGP